MKKNLIMQAFVFYLSLPFIYLFSLLPLKILYIISDLLYILIFYIFSYRKKLVIENISKSFPEKTNKEIKLIVKKFYHHFCDIIVESVKAFTISKSEIKKRIFVENPELLKKLYKEEKNIIAVTSHYNNWEWSALILDLTSPHKAIGIYKPLNNIYFDKLLKKNRARFGLSLISMDEVFKFYKNNKELILSGFIADQWPSNYKRAIWINFLNRMTAFFLGPEKYSKFFKNNVVLYGKINKIKRGYYSIKYIEVSLNPGKENFGEITKKWVKILEKSILEIPEFWLWTHNRWKHSINDLKNPII